MKILYPRHSSIRHIAVSLTLLASATLSAQTITYIDATQGSAGNTFQTGQPPSNTSWTNRSAKSNDNQWAQRVGRSNGSTIYQAAIPNTNAIPELTTQISGLADGSYDIWVFAWDGNQDWGIDVGLTSGELTNYTLQKDAVKASELEYSQQILTQEGNRTLYAIYVGLVVVSGGQPVNVYIDSSTNDSQNLRDRTWYDGVGYAKVSNERTANYVAIPEPALSGLILSLTAMSGLILRRRTRS